MMNATRNNNVRYVAPKLGHKSIYEVVAQDHIVAEITVHADGYSVEQKHVDLGYGTELTITAPEVQKMVTNFIRNLRGLPVAEAEKPVMQSMPRLVLVPGKSDRERANRAAKAERLASVLMEGGIALSDVRRMQDEQWELAAKAARVQIPSEETRKLVVRLMEGMAR